MVNEEKFNAGRVLVVGSQGGGKTYLATKLSEKTVGGVQYEEEFGGTIETEYLKVAFDKGRIFSLLLPIGGQEKWASLRTAFGETAEGIIVILDSLTKAFWPNSIKQALSVSPMIPYENYPVLAVVTKEDQNRLLQEKAGKFAEVIVDGLEKAIKNGFTYWARGFKIIKRHEKVADPERIPFSQFEQIATNAMEREFFRDLVPGNAKKARMLLPGFSLVNCRLFARALTSALGRDTGENAEAILSLLNEMRPTMLELDTNWTQLNKKYPEAGPEPWVPGSISVAEVERAIRDQLLATDHDIHHIRRNLESFAGETGWRVLDAIHASAFVTDGLQQISDNVYRLLQNVSKAEPASKFTLLEPMEELF